MATSYTDAVAIVEAVAAKLQCLSSEELPLAQTVGRITAREYVSPLVTPTFDSSAMDGFAVVAGVTRTASQDNPVILRVQGCILAGDHAVRTTSSSGNDGLEPCVEIMTGARFPIVQDGEKDFDAVARKEDVVELDVKSERSTVRCIQVTKPLAANDHKRFAGGDFGKGELILCKHETVRPHHIMAMASVGFKAIEVRRRVRVGFWSTGRELALPPGGRGCHSQIMDANGPYLEAALSASGAEAKFLGILDDDETAFKEALLTEARSRCFDILITTGAVSKGKLDFVPSGLASLGSTVRFHGVAMRPGHPVIFATLPLSSMDPSGEHNSHLQTNGSSENMLENELAIFGLPGNPVATAACMRFLVAPYINSLRGTCQEIAIRATVSNADGTRRQRDFAKPSENDKRGSKLDHFKHGFLSADSSTTGWSVRLSADQSPAKLRPFSAANCWCHIRPAEAGTTVDCFPF